ncbi:2578_t:CDS:1, partial [Gigaspora rosea]
NITQKALFILIVNSSKDSPIEETPIVGSPVKYVNLYRAAWNNNPELRPNIEKIRIELDFDL